MFLRNTLYIAKNMNYSKYFSFSARLGLLTLHDLNAVNEHGFNRFGAGMTNV